MMKPVNLQRRHPGWAIMIEPITIFVRNRARNADDSIKMGNRFKPSMMTILCARFKKFRPQNGQKIMNDKTNNDTHAPPFLQKFLLLGHDDGLQIDTDENVPRHRFDHVVR